MNTQLKQLKALWPIIPQWARDKILKLAQTSTKREVWKDIIPLNQGKFTQAVAGKYQVSNLGRVRHKKSRRQTSIYESTLYNRPLHPIVCAAFHGPKPFPKAVVRHLDGDSQNNCANNLRWGTPQENADDKKKHNE